ncbi:hypothetical protein DL96DRAFT_1702039 [Flagelloscypha sp. PMI_526]|nr:hypothetical protein DL96DRAFT_1702039 [Flagelloscypha sp. PMI_526]
MGRWTQYDEDEYRLPDGFERIGYDADVGKFYFRDNNDGSVWEGEEGAEFSEMTKISNGASASHSSDDEDEDDIDIESGRRGDGYQAVASDPTMARSHPRLPYNAGAYRTLFPFFIIIGTILLLAWKFIIQPSFSHTHGIQCPSFSDVNDGSMHNSSAYIVQPGDTCYEIAKSHHCDWALFAVLNDGVKCERLMPGTSLCLPTEPTDNVTHVYALH